MSVLFGSGEHCFWFKSAQLVAAKRNRKRYMAWSPLAEPEEEESCSASSHGPADELGVIALAIEVATRIGDILRGQVGVSDEQRHAGTGHRTAHDHLPLATT